MGWFLDAYGTGGQGFTGFDSWADVGADAPILELTFIHGAGPAVPELGTLALLLGGLCCFAARELRTCRRQIALLAVVGRALLMSLAG